MCVRVGETWFCGNLSALCQGVRSQKHQHNTVCCADVFAVRVHDCSDRRLGVETERSGVPHRESKPSAHRHRTARIARTTRQINGSLKIAAMRRCCNFGCAVPLSHTLSLSPFASLVVLSLAVSIVLTQSAMPGCLQQLPISPTVLSCLPRFPNHHGGHCYHLCGHRLDDGSS